MGVAVDVRDLCTATGFNASRCICAKFTLIAAGAISTSRFAP
jgi:hypothetical protein